MFQAIDSAQAKGLESSMQMTPLLEDSNIMMDSNLSKNGGSSSMMSSGVLDKTTLDEITFAQLGGNPSNSDTSNVMAANSGISQYTPAVDLSTTIDFSTAKLSEKGSPLSGESNYLFEIAYSKDAVTGLQAENAIVGSSKFNLSELDVVVKGPGNFVKSAELISVTDPEDNTNSNTVRASYQVEAPGGYWDKADNGNYSVTVKSNGVYGNNGSNSNEVKEYKPGNFNIDINAGKIEIEPTVLSSETKETAKIKIKRLDGSDGVVNVKYTTVDGTAIRDADYIATSGSVSFQPGQVVKTVEIPVLKDTNPESDETFKVAITEVDGGATLKSPGSSIVTLVDSSAPLPSDLTSVDTRYLFSLRVRIAPPIEIGEKYQGSSTRRSIFELVSGGTFDGPAGQGKLLESGAEWLTIRSDGVAVADARLALETDDKQLIYAQMVGFADNYSEAIQAATSQAATSGTKVNTRNLDYFRLTLQFETGSQRYSWLNQVVTVAKGSFPDLANGILQFDIFQVL